MARATFGTDTLTGLNVGTAPHKIAPHELQVSERGFTEKEGAWRTARGPKRKYSGYSSISCFAAGRMDGSTHLVWMDGNTLYDNGSSVGTITAGSSMKIIAIDDKFLILGGTVNYLYDGDHIREQGTWQPDDTDRLYLQKYTPTEFGTNITAITSANPGVVTCAAHGLETGDWVYLDSLTEMTELNGRKFLVTRVDANSFSINENTTDFTTESSATGTYKRYAGLEGVYKWYMTCTVELSSGRVLESRPRGLRLNSAGTDAETWDAEPITMTTEEVVYIGQDVQLYGGIFWARNSAQLFGITGTIGTDYSPGIRIYRTKQDGTDFYLEREYTHGDDSLSFLDSVDDAYFLVHDGDGDNYGAFFGASDIDLGAVYTATALDHGNPPVSSLAATVGQRLFLNDTSNPERYYWSHLDGIEYYNTLDWNKMPDTITLMEGLDRDLVMMSQDRVWVDRFTGGLPDVREIRTDRGSSYGISAVTDDGVLFLEEDGLWLFDGARVIKISRRGIDTIDTPKSIAATADTIYMSGLYDSYTVRQRDSGMVWHGGGAAYPLASASGGALYGASLHDVSELFEGTFAGGKMTTAAFNAGREIQVDRVILDIEGTSVPLVWVNGNRQSDTVPHYATAPSEDGSRRRVWVDIPRLSNHVFEVALEATGELTVYGVWLEVSD